MIPQSRHVVVFMTCFMLRDVGESHPYVHHVIPQKRDTQQSK